MMSGRDEQPRRAPEFPACSYCGEKTWIQKRVCTNYHYVGVDPGEDRVPYFSKWREGADQPDYVMGWRCYNCDRSARHDQTELINEFYDAAEIV